MAGRSRVVMTGAIGSAPTFVAAALARAAARSVVVVLAHLDDAEEAHEELRSLGVPALALPAIEATGAQGLNLEQFAARLAACGAADALAAPTVVLCPIQALMQLVPTPGRIGALSRTLRAGRDEPVQGLIDWLVAAGYRRADAIEEPGDFARRGGIVDVFPVGGSGASGFGDDSSIGVPVRLDFFGDALERIHEIDLESMGSDRSVAGVTLCVADEGLARAAVTRDEGRSFLDLLPREALALLVETMEVVEQGRGYYERVADPAGIVGPPEVLRRVENGFHAMAELNHFSAGASSADTRIELPVGPCPAFPPDAADAVRDLVALGGEPGARVVVCCQNEGEASRLAELLEAHGAAGASVTRAVGYVHRGFAWRDEGAGERLLVVPYHELVGRFGVRRRAGRLRAGRAMDTFLDFGEGDYVVHREHGIARFVGLTLMTPRELPGRASAWARASGRAIDPEPEEYLTLEFAGKSRLHVPAVQIDKVQRYVGGYSGKPPLSTLGGVKWKNQTERAAASVRDLAAELLRVRAAREHMPGIQYPGDTPWQREFEAEFPHDETDDQLAALAEIKRDMGAPRPMDRLVCGDVGFGKTELAIRAAFKACEFGRQVGVLVPTTVLAEQHERTFRSRFAGYPFRVESLSRFKTGKETNDVLAAVRRGHVDVVIGTHRLLSGDVRFADLGLVVVDEEQRFGVEHKEALLRLRLAADVLTLSATPIPRTLHMAMLGLRDISSLTTPPMDRRAVVTEVIPFNTQRIRQAIERELAREGQVFFVHNRVYDITSVADDVRRLVPDARVIVGHGQMAPGELEGVMLAFVRGDADILVSTTIIESGIDIPRANTIIVNDAHRFGLADLHQLRGRVGRSKERAYCYLLLPEDATVKDTARRRLKAIEQFSMLGAGFKIAMRDLEIRGAGNILGAEQSGHIAAIGYEMYCHLLEQAVRDLKHERPPAIASGVAIEVGLTGVIPKAYIPSVPRRLEAYRRLASAASLDQLDRARQDLTQAYGEAPEAARRLFDLAALRIALAGFSVRTVTLRAEDCVLVCDDPRRLADALGASGAPGSVRILAPKQAGEASEVYFRPPPNYLEPATLARVLRHRLIGPDPPAGAGLSRGPSDAPTRVPAHAPSMTRRARPARAPRNAPP